MGGCLPCNWKQRTYKTRSLFEVSKVAFPAVWDDNPREPLRVSFVLFTSDWYNRSDCHQQSSYRHHDADLVVSCDNMTRNTDRLTTYCSVPLHICLQHLVRR